MEQTEKYYSACSEATERVADIRSTLAGYLASAEDKAEYFSQVKTFADTHQGAGRPRHDAALCLAFHRAGRARVRARPVDREGCRSHAR